MSLNESEGWPRGTERLAPEAIPDGDLFVVGSSQLDQLKDSWRIWLDREGADRRHPNEDLDYRGCYVVSRDTRSLELAIEVNVFDRWQMPSRRLPYAQIVACVHWPEDDCNPYLVVSQSWFDSMYGDLFSIYAMVDVVGMKELMRSGTPFDSEPFARLKKRISALAIENPGVLFLTFADNVLLKQRYKAGKPGKAPGYEPERVIRLIDVIRQAICEELRSDSYAVITEGANAYPEADSVDEPTPDNHKYFPSLGAPFAELLDIDRAARKSIQEGRHAPCDLYISESVLESLKFASWRDRDTLYPKLVGFSSKLVAQARARYLPISRRGLVLKGDVHLDSSSQR